MKTMVLSSEKKKAVISRVTDYFHELTGGGWRILLENEEWVICEGDRVACRIPTFPNQYNLEAAFVYGCRDAPRARALEWNEMLDGLVNKVLPRAYEEIGIPIDPFGAGSFGENYGG